METRQGKRIRVKKYNPYGEDFVRDRTVLSDVAESIVGLDEIMVTQEIDLVKDTKQDWIDDRSEPDVEIDPEVEQMHEQVLTILRVLEWVHDLPADPRETVLTIQDVDQTSIIYISPDNTESSWVAPDGPYVFQNPISICSIMGDRRGRRRILLSGSGVGLTHTKNLMLKNF